MPLPTINLSGGVKMESPLIGVAGVMGPLSSGVNQAFSVYERPFLELINVKGEVDSDVFLAGIKAATGVVLPIVPNTVAEGEDYVIYWLAPNEWLIQSTQPRVPVLDAALSKLLTGQFAAVVDVSSGNTTLVMSGEKVRAVLQKGCPLDFHPRVFTVGQCAQSHYFKAGVVLRPLGNGNVEVIIRRSFADYFGRILADAAEEYLREHRGEYVEEYPEEHLS
ncbi:sarcosine oxidase subunit gamma [Glaciimonas sp. PAMC28666]|uniref:sarcosine oxidase subunit gamma n=1 Tax=Glaciimonas sp. PAMC28666 TaxID=2807626 RepID=UPI0019633422|nr:sarcosine oxidase subunit gamma family protein [Glaciimonas sp. PAMC28666]QRX84997.1 sarcosine oxidase subunit gamma [Glaciimonas sp. PAMC28666]